MNETEAKELLIYMITSAAGLPDEPHSYGPIRMIEASARLTKLLLQLHPEDAPLQNVLRTIEAGRDKSMNDPEGFRSMLQDAVLAAVDLM